MMNDFPIMEANGAIIKPRSTMKTKYNITQMMCNRIVLFSLHYIWDSCITVLTLQVTVKTNVAVTSNGMI